MYAVGKIPGGFIKREGRPSEKAILASRLTDRPIRPLFPEGFRNDVQVLNIVMSVDQDCEPQIAAMIGTSAALSISDVPFSGPIGGVKLVVLMVNLSSTLRLHSLKSVNLNSWLQELEMRS